MGAAFVAPKAPTARSLRGTQQGQAQGAATLGPCAAVALSSAAVLVSQARKAKSTQAVALKAFEQARKEDLL